MKITGGCGDLLTDSNSLNDFDILTHDFCCGFFVIERKLNYIII